MTYGETAGANSAPLSALAAGEAAVLLWLGSVEPTRRQLVCDVLVACGVQFEAVPPYYAETLTAQPPARCEQLRADEIQREEFLPNSPSQSTGHMWNQLLRVSDAAIRDTVNGVDESPFRQPLAQLFIRRPEVPTLDGHMLHSLLGALLQEGDYALASHVLGYDSVAFRQLGRLVTFVNDRYPDKSPLPPIPQQKA